MSIGKRFVRLVRSNLNALLDKGGSDFGGGARIEDLSDEELERELARRKQRREAAQQAAADPSRTVDEQAWREVEEAVSGSERYRTSGQRARANRRSTTSSRNNRLARLYAQLECPYGADADTVRKHYRALMRKYHPDMHSKDPDKQRLATELSQRLTSAYNELRNSLNA